MMLHGSFLQSLDPADIIATTAYFREYDRLVHDRLVFDISLAVIIVITTTTISRPFVRNYSSELVPEETFNHSYLS